MAQYREDYSMRTVADVFNTILDRDGILDPEAMHDEFADPNHPLHHRYEWDDATAGRKHRIQQIRGDIRLVKVQHVDQTSGEVTEFRAYSSLKYSSQPDARGYVETDQLIARDPIAQELLQRRLLRQIDHLKKQYGHLSDFVLLVRRELLNEEGTGTAG